SRRISFNGIKRVKAIGAAGLKISRKIETTITQKIQYSKNSIIKFRYRDFLPEFDIFFKLTLV
ncbi:MAG: hypothetical protein ACW99E_21735, partial [Promethearchaeota archaeon]